MKLMLSLFLAPLSLLLSSVEASAQAPNADNLLKTARRLTTLQHQSLAGQIRKDTRKDIIKIPVGLFLRGKDIQFTYYQPKTGKPIRFHVRHGNGRFDLFEIVNGKTKPFPDAQLGQAIEGTDLSFEDLAMRFLYWPKAVMVGPDKIGSRKCWLLRVANPGKGGRYSHVKVWIDQKSGGLVQIEGYNKQERRLKRFQVTHLMKVGNTHTLKRMRIDSYHQETGKLLGNTYLEFDKPKRVAPKGLR
jgi:hypothetical protein